MKTISILLSFVLAVYSSAAQLITPQPVSVTLNEGTFDLTAETVIVAPASLSSESNSLRASLAPATGWALPVQAADAPGSQIKLIIDPNLTGLGREGYTMQVRPDGISIQSAAPAGIFYGIQSLIQLLPTEIVSTEKVDTEWTVPCITITDQPRFSWRGFMLDEARHFKGEAEVKKLLDQMAALKMNTFHWHLTDDQGWRVEIKKYPRLTSVGSKRTNTEIGTWGSGKLSGKPHSGFYTQEQIKGIVAYAAARHITIVPEIGMPGHACAAIAAYPELGTNKKPIDVMITFGKALDVYDPSSEVVYRMLSEILDEVIALFPSQVIHIGGDEVKFEQWQGNESIAKLMERKKLKTMADVQLYFTNRMAEIVQSKGRNIMGWNEILGDDLHGFLKDGQTAKAASLDKDTVVHFWKGSPDLAKRAIKDGHTIVNSLHSSTYLDYSYAKISLEDAYSFDPVISGLTPDEEKRIIGTGCQMWSEWIPTVAGMERQIYPRIAAYAEVGWTSLENKNYPTFKKRLDQQLKRWGIQGIGYATDTGRTFTAGDFFNYNKVDQWTPDQAPVEFATAGMVKAPGTYEVAFVYQKGPRPLILTAVELLENGTPVAKDAHESISGGRLANVVYSLKLENFRPDAKYSIRVTTKGTGKINSTGEVKMRTGE